MVHQFLIALESKSDFVSMEKSTVMDCKVAVRGSVSTLSHSPCSYRLALMLSGAGPGTWAYVSGALFRSSSLEDFQTIWASSYSHRFLLPAY